MSDPSRQSLRHFLAALEHDGALMRRPETVDPRFEVSAWLNEIWDGPAVLFEKTAGSSGLTLVGNVLNSIGRIAAGLGTTPSELQRKITAAMDKPIPPRLVASGPCQEIAVADPDLAHLPVPTFFEHETGAYITAGAIVAHDGNTGHRNLSFARLKPLGGNRAMIGIAPNHHLAIMARAAASRGEKLEIAVTIGNHPAVLIAAALYLRLGDDEMEVAGALLGEAVEVVRCSRGDLLVPAQSEIVLEATLDPDDLVEEGSVSEFHGLYEQYGPGQVVAVHRLTRRHDAIFQAIEPGFHPEHVLIGGVAIAAGLARHARATVPSVHEVAVGMGGAGRLHAVVSLKEKRPGDARKAMFAVWGAVNLIKQITVVDDDIDCWDQLQVEWAVATRMKADRDLVVVPGVRADRSEPLERDGLVAKLGIDATRREGDRPDWVGAAPPQAVIDKIRAALKRS
ncbi:MAG: UbiD family decarboxylase [Alphaproteobacteria bacterium]|nr:UbiD family decarboxylase [Alphaproteobacteria bacterium]